MPQEYTIQLLKDRHKLDKFNNKTFDVKFTEDERTVYAAFKNEPQVGERRYGTIEEGQYGPRFKGAMKPDDYTPDLRPVSTPTHISQSLPANGMSSLISESDHIQDPRLGSQLKGKVDASRQEDIRWMVTLKEASSYVAKNRPDLASDEWAIEVVEYANALFKLCAGPDKSTAEQIMGAESFPL